MKPNKKKWRLLNGDCLEQMKRLKDNSVDSIVCDPPYGLTFMGKNWDHGIPGKEYWQEALRVLKPGGYLLACGGSRTFHRLFVAIEDAGFELRDTIMWLYGCVSEDTEILTDNGWKTLFNFDNEIDKVLAYNPQEDAFKYEKSEKKSVYQNQHTAYRIVSDKTNQIVSANHRVLVERNGRKVFVKAETCKRKESIPVLESLSDLPESLYDLYKRTSNEKQDLFNTMQQVVDFKKENGQNKTQRKTQTNSGKMCGLQYDVLENELSHKKNNPTLLFKTVQRKTKSKRTCQAFTQRSKWLEQNKLSFIQKQNVREEQSSLEGWHNLQTSKGKLQRCKVRKMPKRIVSNGKKRWVCDGTQIGNSTAFQTPIRKKRSSASHRSQSSKQPTFKSNVVSRQQRTQKIRTTMATVEPIKYDGLVWCVSVPSKAFVARRKGQIFITGNSGFPKSYNIAKGIEGKLTNGSSSQQHWDKLDGEKIDSKIGYTKLRHKHGNSPADYSDKQHTINVKFKTEEAKNWEGWGTALKPSYEPICLARKPIEKTNAENVLKWGTGGINIDASRIGNENTMRPTGKPNSSQSLFGLNNGGSSGSELGRYPANTILECLCNESEENNHTNPECPCFQLDKQQDKASRFFYVAKASKRERNEGLPDKQTNNHPTVKPIKLMSYLIKLVTPPNGIVLDPFMGSGSTGVAAIKEGFQFIGIDKEKEYCELAKQRIKSIE